MQGYMFQKIALISIPVSDQEAALSFYTEILGGKVVQDMPFGPGTRWLRVGLPGVETQLVLATWFDAMPPGSLQGLVVATRDIKKAHAELRKRGLDISDIDKQPYGQEATFTDPDGNSWILQQPAD
jgi:catechol 2,3-dioxygenase-like lactoylglutathione lyase family enzyme